MNRKHLNLLVPQWQGSGPDYSIYHGAFALRENYLKDVDMIQVPVTDQPISPVKNDIMGYDEILAQLKAVNETLKSYKPDTVFTVGGGCDADLASMAYLNADKGYQNVYVHIDLDVLDAEDFPFAPVPEPDGLNLDAFIQMLKAVAEECHVVGLGLLEYSGTKESVRSEVLEEIIRIGTKLSS